MTKKYRGIDEIIKDNKACINCGYIFTEHAMQSFDKSMMLAFVCPHQQLKNGDEVLTYGPGDNLDVIEYLAEKKGLV
jgi:hypothetical protein